jgi:hypothetical protein
MWRRRRNNRSRPTSVRSSEQTVVGAPPALPQPREPSMFPNQRVFDLFVRSSGKLEDVWRDQLSTDETVAGVFGLFEPPAASPAVDTSAPTTDSGDSGFFGDLALLGDEFGDLDASDDSGGESEPVAAAVTENGSGDMFLQQFFQLPSTGFNW